MRAKTMLLLMMQAAAACGDMNRAATEFTPSADRLATAGTDESPPRAYVASEDRRSGSAAAPRTRGGSATLEPVAGDRLRGNVRLASLGNLTSVATRLSEGAPETTYEGYLRQGTCTGLGPSLASLVPASTDFSGAGRSDSHLSIPLDSLARRPHVIVFGRRGRVQSGGAVHDLVAPGSDSLRLEEPAGG